MGLFSRRRTDVTTDIANTTNVSVNPVIDVDVASLGEATRSVAHSISGLRNVGQSLNLGQAAKGLGLQGAASTLALAAIGSTAIIAIAIVRR